MKIRKPVTMTGMLRWDVELRFTPGGHAVSMFQIVTPDGEFQQCEAWREMAEQLAEHSRRDRPITVWGTIQHRSWMDREGREQIRSVLVLQRYEL